MFGLNVVLYIRTVVISVALLVGTELLIVLDVKLSVIFNEAVIVDLVVGVFVGDAVDFGDVGVVT